MKRGNVEKMANVEEKTVYDNFIGQKAKDNRPATLAEFLDEDEDAIFEEPWQEHWQGMPEFEQDENKPYKTINVHFRTKEDYEEFAKIIEQPLTTKTKSIWHPRLEITKNALMRWIEENDD